MAQFDINCAANRIYLPKDASGHPTRTIHIGRHWNIVSEMLAKKMDEIVEAGQGQQWTTSKYAEELRKMLAAERKKLRNGD